MSFLSTNQHVTCLNLSIFLPSWNRLSEGWQNASPKSVIVRVYSHLLSLSPATKPSNRKQKEFPTIGTTRPLRKISVPYFPYFPPVNGGKLCTLVLSGAAGGSYGVGKSVYFCSLSLISFFVPRSPRSQESDSQVDTPNRGRMYFCNTNQKTMKPIKSSSSFILASPFFGGVQTSMVKPTDPGWKASGNSRARRTEAEKPVQ